MIPALLHQLDAAKARTHLPWRSLCGPVPYASVMRWRQRQRQGQPVCQTPGPQKPQPFNAAEFYPLLRELPPGPSRTPGTGALYARFADTLSRRHFQALVQERRRDHLQALKHITWLHPGTAWSCDATEYGAPDTQIIPVQDLASRYRFAPLVLDRLDGQRIADHLAALFRRHGPPLFLKRDNGSPFNCLAVDEVLARFGVLPLNSPPHFPRYNGAMEKSIRDFKAALGQREAAAPVAPNPFALLVELTAQELNHQPRRCLHGRTACAVFHDDTLRLRWNRPERQALFRLLLRRFGQKLEAMPEDDRHPRHATAWRTTVEHWLRCQHLITVRLNPKPNVSTHSSEKWSHN
jgi:transposase InsO family protein